MHTSTLWCLTRRICWKDLRYLSFAARMALTWQCFSKFLPILQIHVLLTTDLRQKDDGTQELERTWHPEAWLPMLLTSNGSWWNKTHQALTKHQLKMNTSTASFGSIWIIETHYTRFRMLWGITVLLSFAMLNHYKCDSPLVPSSDTFSQRCFFSIEVC